MSTYILHIETAMKTCSVCLSKDGECLDVIESHPTGYEHAEKLNIYIEQVLAKNNLTTKSLNAVAVSAGPGSYTGLRIGVATAKGLCFALKIPLLSIDSLSVMMAHFRQTNHNENGDLFFPMIDARRMEVYQAIFTSDEQMISPPEAKVIDADTFAEYKEKLVLFGDGADKLSELDFAVNVTIIPHFKTSAQGMVKSIYTKYQANDFEDLAYFDPIYLKEFQAG